MYILDLSREDKRTLHNEAILRIGEYVEVICKDGVRIKGKLTSVEYNVLRQDVNVKVAEAETEFVKKREVITKSDLERADQETGEYLLKRIEGQMKSDTMNRKNERPLSS